MLFPDMHMPHIMVLPEQPGSIGVGGTPICPHDAAGNCFNSGQSPFCECTTGHWATNYHTNIHIPQHTTVLPEQPGSVGVGGTPICYNDASGNCFNSGQAPYCECTTGHWNATNYHHTPVQQELAVLVPGVDGSGPKSQPKLFTDDFLRQIAAEEDTASKPHQRMLNDDFLRQLAEEDGSALELRMLNDDFLRQLAASEPPRAVPEPPAAQRAAVHPSMGHMLLAGHACTLAGLNAMEKGSAKNFRQDAIANAGAMTPLGAMLLRDYVMPETKA